MQYKPYRYSNAPVHDALAKRELTARIRDIEAGESPGWAEGSLFLLWYEKWASRTDFERMRDELMPLGFDLYRAEYLTYLRTLFPKTEQ